LEVYLSPFLEFLVEGLERLKAFHIEQQRRILVLMPYKSG